MVDWFGASMKLETGRIRQHQPMARLDAEKRESLSTGLIA